MGWVTYYRPPGQTDREHFMQEVLDADRHEILDCATVNSVFYAAVKDKDTGDVWALVCMLQRTRGYINFGYKSMDETVGPCCYDCPARILDLLTPTKYEYAQVWRETCRKRIEDKARAQAKTAKAKVSHGTVIKLSQPLKFQGGYEAQEFQLMVNGRIRRWIGNPGGEGRFACRLPRDWATRYQWEKMSA